MCYAGKLISGLGSIADQYDGFILDQFGVMHNGVMALPGAQVLCVMERARNGEGDRETSHVGAPFKQRE